ncbi:MULTISPECIES: 1,4-alpha-glucan branching protein GlgB [unclassified Variovorax]|uniref:1,4-alpha-glucan branching protein GlgB n=1 Tax=unclassified Variovorax TaxID=663243 RepID=UPI00076CCD34|nr:MULTISPECIES: 1,4-alpha-glucan branching protein GlgB [unclassified Variovorax]KWT97333.1 1,4-alpha-glucan (glycogen) branching enzyme, GH-13-type [Variovorax sp. WDL1]PNG60004.1 1,4-alpha-glucan branching enzyme GlgB [Variovorax sp. B4]PNG60204.1 1,4-alpha-glucan branching enzyme GlgB [Variovorax sp. B2]VTV13967.1 1,4-alpha-glucan branching enzyme GlgB [Variovorax sp. WDL1]
MPITPAFSAQDRYFFSEGTHSRLYDQLGCHLRNEGGARFAVWAPNAASVSVVGDWNGWNGDAHPLQAHEDSGIWTGTACEVAPGQAYKYRIRSRHSGYQVDKADPFAFFCETPPATASRAWSLNYEWGDGDWMATRAARNALDAPMSTYEVHLGSWRRRDGKFLNYRELAPLLADYVREMGFTHVELMPVTEHPFYGSWGYQTTAYFAPTSRYGTPQDFMYFVDHLHQRGIGVLLDWVPSHFPTDEHGLGYFDGTHLYEHADPMQGFHPEWKSSIFNYGRHEVRSFLVSSGLFWLDKYHIDGLRVDAVASMLYLDYGRAHGEWIPNRHGGRENLEAIEFLQTLNRAVYREHPDTVTIAEESTAWPRVSRPTDMDGLGFGMKWNMGWMHDSLAYMHEDPVHRRYHHHQMTFSLVYAFSENFVLPLSHDEVVYGKGSLLRKMPGDNWQQFANLRALFGLMWGHPGKKLLFMGGEFGQRREWTHDGELEWWVAALDGHAGLQRFVAQLNHFYRATPALHELDFSGAGFEWVVADDAEHSVFAFLRKPREGAPVLVVSNMTPVPRTNYLLGVPNGGFWRERLNSDASEFGGAGWGNFGGVEASPVRSHGRMHSLCLTLPPLSTLILEHDPHA